jgi:hypothetical protein
LLEATRAQSAREEALLQEIAAGRYAGAYGAPAKG